MLVDVVNLGVAVGGREIIYDLSFEVGAGETLGFLGSNGSGKSTSLRCLLGMMRHDRGSLKINGRPFSPRSSTRVGYLPEERGIYRKERVIDVMIYFGTLKGLSRREAMRWSHSFLEEVGLEDKQKLRLDKLSGGQQQKIQLGITIMNDPELLILDEPAKGLDPVNRQLLMELIGRSRARGTGVVLVTHHMEDVERLCDRALLLKAGRAEAYGTVSDIREQFGPRRIRVRCEDTIESSARFTVVSSTPGSYELEPISDASDAEILARLMKGGRRVSAFEPRATSMEEVFVSVYGRGEAA